MALNQAIDIISEQWTPLISLFSGHLPNRDSWMYGSWYSGTSRPVPNLDMVVFTVVDQDEAGFYRALTLEEIGKYGYVLAPGRYVGLAAIEEDDVPFGERFSELKRMLAVQFDEADELGALIQNELEEVGEHG